MEAWNGTADPWTQGIGVFDMTNLVWRDSYNASARPYTVPTIVKQYYDKKYVIPSKVFDTITSIPVPILNPILIWLQRILPLGMVISRCASTFPTFR